MAMAGLRASRCCLWEIELGLPGKMCPLCSKPGRMTVENCEGCGDRFCPKHITFKGDVGWTCNRCSRNIAKNKDKKRGIYEY